MVRLTFADVLDLVPVKPGQRRLARKTSSTQTLLNNSLSKASSVTDLDKVAIELLEVKVARLDWRDIEAIENLEPLTNLQDLYLQHNKIKLIENLEFHMHLSFLALGHNSITTVANLQHLRKLVFLDLSHNQLCELDVAELPCSLISVDLRHNPIQQKEYRDRIMGALPKLCILDGETVKIGADNVSDEDGSESEEEEAEEHEKHEQQQQQQQRQQKEEEDFDKRDEAVEDEYERAKRLNGEGIKLTKTMLRDNDATRESTRIDESIHDRRKHTSVETLKGNQREGELEGNESVHVHRDSDSNSDLKSARKGPPTSRRRQPEYYKQRLMKLSEENAKVIRSSVSTRVQAMIERSKDRTKKDSQVFEKRMPATREGIFASVSIVNSE